MIKIEQWLGQLYMVMKALVRLMLYRGADNYNETMINAARTVCEAIVRMMLEKGVNDYTGKHNFC